MPFSVGVTKKVLGSQLSSVLGHKQTKGRSQTKAHRQNFANRMGTTGNTSGVGGVA